MPVKVIGPSDDQLKQKITDAAKKEEDHISLSVLSFGSITFNRLPEVSML